MKVMKKISLFLLVFTLFATACNNSNTNFPPADNSLDAAREFIDGCLKGEFEKALFYMQKDETNLQNLEKMKASYARKSKADKKQYKQASIIIEEIDSVNDSTDVINYKNSFDRIARKVKVIKAGEGWFVDFKYTLSGNI